MYAKLISEAHKWKWNSISDDMRSYFEKAYAQDRDLFYKRKAVRLLESLYGADFFDGQKIYDEEWISKERNKFFRWFSALEIDMAKVYRAAHSMAFKLFLLKFILLNELSA